MSDSTHPRVIEALDNLSVGSVNKNDVALLGMLARDYMALAARFLNTKATVSKTGGYSKTC
jgi:hypothetical protein